MVKKQWFLIGLSALIGCQEKNPKPTFSTYDSSVAGKVQEAKTKEIEASEPKVQQYAFCVIQFSETYKVGGELEETTVQVIEEDYKGDLISRSKQKVEQKPFRDTTMHKQFVSTIQAIDNTEDAKSKFKDQVILRVKALSSFSITISTSKILSADVHSFDTYTLASTKWETYQ